MSPGISLGMRTANETRRYIVTTSLIGWAHTKTDLWSHETDVVQQALRPSHVCL